MLDIGQLLEFDRLAREDGEKYKKKRFLFSEIENMSGNHFIGIAGPRGSGKTILLKQFAIEKENSFYLSLDTVKDDIFKIVKKLQMDLNINLFLLDEVHFHSSFDEGLKKIYDFLKNKRKKNCKSMQLLTINPQKCQDKDVIDIISTI